MRDRLAAVIGHCTVHNSITMPPEVRIEVRAPAGAL
jgi:hypothetical protein